MPWLRGLLVAALGWITLRLAAGPQGCFLDLVNLAFHEAGHLFLAPFGETLHVLGGTIGQLAVPAGLVAYFLRVRRDRFAAVVCLWWAGENLVHVAIYMADARDLALPLVGGGEHDWNTLFDRFGLLGPESVAAIAGTTRVLGFLVMWSAFAALAGLALRAETAEKAGGEKSHDAEDSDRGEPAGPPPRPQPAGRDAA